MHCWLASNFDDNQKRDENNEDDEKSEEGYVENSWTEDLKFQNFRWFLVDERDSEFGDCATIRRGFEFGTEPFSFFVVQDNDRDFRAANRHWSRRPFHSRCRSDHQCHCS